MTVTILDYKTLYDDDGTADRQGARFEIEDGGPVYLWSHGSIPLGLDKAGIKAWLEDPVRFDAIYTAAEARNILAPTNIFDNPDIEWNKVQVASLRVILQQINILRGDLGRPAISEQTAFDAIKEEYKDIQD